MIINERYRYIGLNERLAVCWVRVWAPGQDVLVVVFTDLDAPENPGASVTNTAEILVTHWTARLAQDGVTLRFIEHYEEVAGSGTFDEICVDGHDVSWQQLRWAEVEALIGEPFPAVQR